jgi:hypothetical protein
LTTGAASQWFGGVWKYAAYGLGWEGWDDGWQFKLWSGGSTYMATASNTAAVAGEWYHVVGTYDGNVMKLYINGEEAASNTIGSHTIDATTVGLWIGWMSGYWDGNLDEVAIYNAALSPTTVESHYNLGRPSTVDANLATHTTYDALGRATDVADPART